MLCLFFVVWQILLPILFILLADVNAIMVVWLMLLPFNLSCCGRCYCQHWLYGWCCCHFDMCCCHCLADVIAKVADGIAYHGGCGLWSDVITISGRWNSHWVTLFYFSFSSRLLQESIGESARTFAERFKEHQKAPSPIYDHSNISGHGVTIDNFSIVGREDQNLIRTIKEAL